MRTRTVAFAAVAAGLGAICGAALARAGARPAGVPGEVQLAGGADVRALCGELKEDGEAAEAVYVMPVPSSAFVFAAYDKKAARLAVNAQKGLVSESGQWELAVVGEPLLALAVPATGKEAARLVKQAKAGELTLWLWFRPARLPQQGMHCVGVASVKGERVRLGVEPLAFALVRGQELVAAGETPAFAAMREREAPVDTATVTVGAAMRTDQRGTAPDEVTRTARALVPELTRCYEKGLAVEPGLRGAVVLGVKLEGNGRVAEARPELDGLGAPEVTACVVARVKAAKFPAGLAARYSVPLRFGPAD
jgi:hypothetical protein